MTRAPLVAVDDAFADLVACIRACRVCADTLPHSPRPVARLHPSARILIVGQAPGVRVHAVGAPFCDPSGVRLREWLGLDEATFYDPQAVAVAPTGLCFPGLTPKGADKPPDRRCAPLWQAAILEALTSVRLIVLAGKHGYAHHLGPRAKGTVTATVAAWREYAPRHVPLPHPSWRNNAWIAKNPWFTTELLPDLRARVAQALA